MSARQLQEMQEAIVNEGLLSREHYKQNNPVKYEISAKKNKN